MARWRDLVCGKVFKVIRILVSGNKEKLKVMVFISGRIMTGTRVNGLTHLNMVKVLTYSLMVIVIPVFMPLENLVVLVITNG